PHDLEEVPARSRVASDARAARKADLDRQLLGELPAAARGAVLAGGAQLVQRLPPPWRNGLGRGAVHGLGGDRLVAFRIVVVHGGSQRWQAEQSVGGVRWRGSTGAASAS